MNRPMFCFAGVYDSVKSAEADYGAIRALHSADIIGSYDAVVISRRADGTVEFHKTEKPTQHGAWTGLAAGAAVAVIAPVAMPVLAAAGGAAFGAWVGHLAHGISRRAARELGETLAQGTAALVVVGINKDADRVQKAADRAVDHMTKRVEGDHDEAARDALATMVIA
jgi:uncharacterized membrane protein